MTTITYPLSRIEGHARVVIDIHDNEVFRADFQAMEMRGFGHYVRGIPAEQITVIVPEFAGSAPLPTKSPRSKPLRTSLASPLPR